MSWPSTAPFPVRLLTDERVLELSDRDALLLQRLYASCDRWGRFSARESTLRLRTAMVSGPALVPAVKRLAAAGFLVLYEAGKQPVGSLLDYEDDLTKRLTEGRAPSLFPDPPTSVQRTVQLTPNVSPAYSSTDAERQSSVSPAYSSTDAERQSSVSPASVQRTVQLTYDHLPPSSSPPTPPLTPTPIPIAKGPSRAAAIAYTPAPARDQGNQARSATPPSVAPARISLDPRAVAARDRWLAHLGTVSPTSCIADGTVDALAADFAADVFVRGVEAHVGDDAKWWRRQPLAALRKRCEWAREQQVEPAVPAKTEAKKSPPTEAKRYVAVKTADVRALTAYALGTATPQQRAAIEGAPLYVRDVGEEHGRERPFADWPQAVRDEALALIREREERRRCELATPGAAP